MKNFAWCLYGLTKSLSNDNYDDVFFQQSHVPTNSVNEKKQRITVNNVYVNIYALVHDSYENGKHLKEFENRISISLSCGLYQLNLCFMADNLGIDIFLISIALEKK